MHHHLVRGPGLWTRLLHAGVDAAIGACFCLGLALAVARDFETLRRGNSCVMSRAGRFVRVLLLASAAAAGCYLATVTIPAIHAWLAQGIAWVVGPPQAAVIVCGFAFFGAGMAARALAGTPAEQTPVWIARFSTFYRLAILGAILFAVLNVLPDSSRLPAYLPTYASVSADTITGLIGRFWDQFPDSFTASARSMLAIENLMWTSLLLAIVCFVIELLFRDNVLLTSPFDRLAESPERGWHFLWLVSGFVVTCLVALPILIVASQVLVLLQLVGPDMLTRGWTN